MATLQIAGLSKRFGDFVAVDDFALAVAHGEFVSLLGPSGCGKSTILRMIAGLIEPDAGSIRLGEEEVAWQPPHRRNIGLVFQSYALFPHMSVFENVAFGLRRRRVAEATIAERVADALALVRLTGLERRLPRELSGGQQQRVALARAIAPRPALLLLDEPLSNLDAKLRDVMRLELRRLQQELRITTVFVTHDQEEALTMSDRICVLSHGVLQQVGTPREIYSHPATPFVAEFFGRSNAFDATVAALGPRPTVTLAGGPTLTAAQLPAGLAVGAPVRVTIRQESVALVEGAAGGADNRFAASLVLASFAGRDQQFVLRLPEGIELTAEARIGRGEAPLEPGLAVEVAIACEDVIVMPAAGAAGAA
ncbi:putative spermidine/putrescine transport system ATP-binding protein [Tistlia consotensis]|uniref:Putative spermidine/putrescine transport system ATP-binding protein n=1 Tax=Tistlia consotensis USBA 355 TaxID=560819 RepID=A0A1Y6BW62_9PROT|nr:ABC transporter ATP-binding protein [Tistlia consotensis]SMF32144.1 putative spermidine/putrescine transport system ATP-binding protein [Tistlia consotensis USBA 355]SNR68200.1 putative spermidine/putrescine transport system ATP-binding protein [Tistlia consotensis]